MAYQVNHTETTNPAKPPYTVQDQSLNTETSLAFPGKNYSGYGPVFAENFLHLLENFSSNISPSNPVQGQLWYDNAAGVNLLKVYDGTGWTAAGSVKKSRLFCRVAKMFGVVRKDIKHDKFGSNYKNVQAQFQYI